jgi:hypothetical protein
MNNHRIHCFDLIEGGNISSKRIIAMNKWIEENVGELIATMASTACNKIGSPALGISLTAYHVVTIVYRPKTGK